VALVWRTAQSDAAATDRRAGYQDTRLGWVTFRPPLTALSSDGNELAIFDLVGQRRPCEARLPAGMTLDDLKRLLQRFPVTRITRSG
jgi:hypothetical protein